MFSRPSNRRHGGKDGIHLNLVPMMDGLVCLIAFLLYSASFLAIVSVESPAPVASKDSVQKALKVKPLQLTLTFHADEVQLWSPFNKFRMRRVPNTQPGQPDLNAVHAALVTIKERFPTETKIIFVPFPGASYDVLVSLMDTSRDFEPTDPPIYAKNKKTGIDEFQKRLFPEVVFGNLLGDEG